MIISVKRFCKVGINHICSIVAILATIESTVGNGLRNLTIWSAYFPYDDLQNLPP